MTRLLITIGILCVSMDLFAPPNCEVYKDSDKCYKSCQAAMDAIHHPQGSYASQQYFEKSIGLCETFAYSYMEKAVPYLKRGLFIEWKELIDKAVALEPQEYLGYRGWCRLQFLRDYNGAIKDIEELKSLVNYDIGYCQTGDYHLNIALALCYKEIGQIDTARALFEEHFAKENAFVGLFDYYHFGVLAYESGNFQMALNHFEKQIEINDDLAETYYFMALCYKKMGQNSMYNQNLSTAKSYYEKGKFRTDTYTETIDKIYLGDIIQEMNKEKETNF
jgi:tetratricopeptide (TPR) repeat protein